MPAQILPDDDELVRLRASGMSYQAIADEYGVSRSAVSQRFLRKNLAGGTARPRKLHDRYLPWRVKNAHIMAYEARCLRLKSRKEQGVELTRQDEGRLRNFEQALHDTGQVIDYDPVRGFFAVAAEPGEDTIRLPADRKVSVAV